jgi:hypothetical protein
LTGEPEPSELSQTETEPFLSTSLSRLLTSEETDIMPLLDHLAKTATRELDSSEEQEETLETMSTSASMFMADTTLTTDTSFGGNATTEPTKAGALIELDLLTQDIHSLMVSSSKSSQEWLQTELSSGTNTLVDINID